MDRNFSGRALLVDRRIRELEKYEIAKQIKSMKMTSIVGLGLCLVSAIPQAARADWDYRRHSDRGGRDHDWDRHGHGFGFFWAGVAIGSIFSSPPPARTRVIVAGTPYYYYDGVYYRTCPNGYVVVNPPCGAVVPVVPSGAAPVMVSGTSYYYAGGAYYLPQPTGYAVVSPPQYAPPPGVAAPPPPPAPAPVTTSRASFNQLGHDWAKDLRDDVATWDQFVSYLRSNIVNSPSADSDEFRDGFISAYGIHGKAAFDKAAKQARGD